MYRSIDLAEGIMNYIAGSFKVLISCVYIYSHKNWEKLEEECYCVGSKKMEMLEECYEFLDISQPVQTFARLQWKGELYLSTRYNN